MSLKFEKSLIFYQLGVKPRKGLQLYPHKPPIKIRILLDNWPILHYDHAMVSVSHRLLLWPTKNEKSQGYTGSVRTHWFLNRCLSHWSWNPSLQSVSLVVERALSLTLNWRWMDLAPNLHCARHSIAIASYAMWYTCWCVSQTVCTLVRQKDDLSRPKEHLTGICLGHINLPGVIIGIASHFSNQAWPLNPGP